jgi:hypothetical protein
MRESTVERHTGLLCHAVHTFIGYAYYNTEINIPYHTTPLGVESNLCYGEGGAGTWSDGKLTTSIGTCNQQ